MAILFDWYENPKTKDKQGEELTLHPRIKLNGSTTTDELRRHIQEYCSLTETDVLAVLDALSHFVGRELGEGRQVHLDGIGYFVPTLTCTEPVTLETKRKSTKVKLKNITFRPDKALRSEMKSVTRRSSSAFPLVAGERRKTCRGRWCFSPHQRPTILTAIRWPSMADGWRAESL